MSTSFYTNSGPAICRSTYHDFIKFINEQDQQKKLYICDTNPFIFFGKLISGLIDRSEIILYDSNLSDHEIRNIMSIESESTIQPDVHWKNIGSIKELLDSLIDVREAKITLFTSGTTSTPKKVTHTLSAIIRNIKVSESHINDIWGLTYSPSHIAGLLVFFQALFNKNTIVYLFKKNRNEIIDAIEKDRISHLSATPSFYRLLFPIIKQLTSIVSLTSGGEVFTEHNKQELLKLFPNAKVHNVYASTEAGFVLTSNGEFFEIPSELHSFVRIVDHELCIHKSLVGNFSNGGFVGDWFYTKDIVEVVNLEPLKFRFIYRNNEIINVGGNKVNPIEVEELLLQMNGIEDARVFGKSNSVLGNILFCELVISDPTLNEPAIRNWLSHRLKGFKIPRYYMFVNSINHTFTGKRKRDQ